MLSASIDLRGLHSELVKLAKSELDEYLSPRNQMRVRNAALGTGALVGTRVGAVAGDMLGTRALLRSMEGTPSVLEPGTLGKLRKEMGLKKLKIRVVPGGKGKTFFVPPGTKASPLLARARNLDLIRRLSKKKGGGISLGSHAGMDAAAHELGHAKNWASLPSRLLQKSRNPLAWAALPAPLVALVAPKDSMVSKVLVPLAATSAGVSIGEELLASHRGVQALKRMGYDPRAIRVVKRNLLRAAGTHALPLAGIVGTTAAVRAVKKPLPPKPKGK